MEVSISDMEKACPKSTNPIRTGVSKENKLEKTGMGNKKCLPLKCVMEKGLAFPVMVGYP